MKIVFLSSFRETSIGGESRVALELAEMLASIGHHVVYICPGDTTGFVANPNGLNRFTMASLGDKEVVVANVSGKHLRQLHQFLEEFQPDVIHTHTYMLIGAVVQRWALRHNIPFIYTAHELPTKLSEFSQGYPIASWIKHSPLFMAIVRAFYRMCSGVVALNQSALNDLRQLGYEGKLFHIHNGRDLKRLNAYPLPLHDDKTRQLIFTGHIMPRKNQEYLVEMMRHLPPHYHLKLVGYIGHKAYHEMLCEKITQYQLHNIEITGRIEPEYIPDLLAEAHVFVSASVLEVQSLAVIEALACGKPLVGLSNQTVDELVDEKCGVVLPQDTSPQVFAQAVVRIAESPNYEALCHHARANVQKHAWDVVIAETLSAYQQCIAHLPSKAPKIPFLNRLYAGGTSVISGLVFWFGNLSVKKGAVSRP